MSQPRSLAPAGTLTPAQEQDPLAVYLVVNGPLDMSAGKIAAQSFQACQRLLTSAAANPELQDALEQWQREGTRTCTREALTEHAFRRVVGEVSGAVMVDEGLTEVEPETMTVHASVPLRRSQLPAALRHKKVPTMTRRT